jgi:predicted nucleic acid-binding protein
MVIPAMPADTTFYQLIASGGRLGEADNLIAGTARYYGIPLVSNDRAFDRVRGLRRIAY